MKQVYGYIRVSTAKQGNGVSLQEQKEAIIRYAEKNTLKIIEWYEELETAAKQGRPLFNKMVKELRSDKVILVFFEDEMKKVDKQKKAVAKII